MANRIEELLGTVSDPTTETRPNRILDLFGTAPPPEGGGVVPQPNRILDLYGLKAPPPPPAPSVLGEFGTGVSAGIQNEIALGQEALALGANALGFEGAAEELVAAANRRAQEVTPAAVGSIEEVSGVGDFMLYLSRITGEQVPILASILAGGGIGGLLARFGTKVAVRGASREILGKAAKLGFGSGAFATTSTIETGATSRELREATGAFQPGESVIAGLAKGSLELLAPAVLGGFYRIGPQLSQKLANLITRNVESRAGRTAAGFLAGTAAEGATETLQEAVDLATRQLVDENYDALGPEARSRLLNSAVAGALVGGVFGAGAGALSPAPIQQDRVDRNIKEILGIPDEEAVSNVPEYDEVHVSGIPGEDYTQPGVRDFTGRYATELQQASGLQGTEGVAIDRTKVDPDQLTATPDFLTTLLTAQDPSVRYLDESQQVAAAEFLQAAIDEAQANNHAFLTGEITEPDFTNVNQLYQSAIELGARVDAPTGAGVRVIGPIEERAIIRKAAARSPGVNRAIIPISTEQVQSFIQGEDGKRIYRIKPFDAIPTKSVQESAGVPKLGEQGGRGIDLDKLDPANISGGLDSLRYFFRKINPATAEEAEAAGLRLGKNKATSFGVLKDMAEQLGTGFRSTSTLTSIEERDTLANLVKSGVRVPLHEGLVDPAGITRGEDIFVAADTIIQVPFVKAPREPIDYFRGPGVTRNTEAMEEQFKRSVDLIGTEPADVFVLEGKEKGFSLDNEAQYVNQSIGPLTRQQTRRAKAMLKAAREIYKQYMPNVKLTIILTEGGGGLFTGNYNRQHIIHMGVQTLLDAHLFDYTKDGKTFTEEVALWKVIMSHEVGHALVFEDFLAQPLGIQEKVLAAYQRVLRGFSGENLATMSRLQGAPTEELLNRFYTANTSTRDLFINNSSVKGSLNYWYNFDEFMAEQAARHFLTQFSKADSLGRFFERLGRKLDRLFREILGVSRDVYTPEREFRDWIDSVRNRKALGAAPLLKDGYSEQKQAAEAVVLPQSAGYTKPPTPQSASESVKNILEHPTMKKFLSKKQRQKIYNEMDNLSFYSRLFESVQQIARRNPQIAELQEYVQELDRMHRTKIGIVSEADRNAQDWQQFAPRGKLADSFAEFIFYIAEMRYLSTQEQEAGILRQPTDAELGEALQRYGLNEDHLNMYNRVKDHFQQLLEMMRLSSIQELERSDLPQEIKDSLLAGIKAEMDNLLKRPYFPFTRFGEWTITVRDRENREVIYFETFESERERDFAVKKVAARFKDQANTLQVGRLLQEQREFAGLPRFFMTTIKARLKLSESQLIALEELQFELSPTQSFRRHFQERKGTPGYSRDALRAYADYFFHGANHVARLLHRDTLDDAINRLDKTTESMQNSDNRKKIVDILRRHFNDIMNPGPDWARIRGWAFHWYLGFNPSSAAINFTQVPLVAWPYLARRFGSQTGAASALRKAMTDVRSLMTHPERFNPETADTETRRLFIGLQEGIREGFLDESQAMELAGVAGHRFLDKVVHGDKLQRFASTMSYASSFLFQSVEKINRRAVFRAAWDLALKNPDAPYLSELRNLHQSTVVDLDADIFLGIDPAVRDRYINAYLAARDAVKTTQFEYAQEARPEFMRGRKGAVFMFFMFTQQMVWFARHMPGGPQWMLMMLFFAGLAGLPGAEDLSNIAKFMARKIFGVNFDLERLAREFAVALAGDEYGSTLGDIALHGVSRVGFGLPAVMESVGVPFPSFDLSSRLGLGRVIPGAQAFSRPDADFSDFFSEAAAGAGGAIFGVGFNALKAMMDDRLPIDDFKRWERAMPTSLRNVSKAARFALEGRERSRTGATVLEFNPLAVEDAAELIGITLGFQPTQLTRKWDLIAAQEDARLYWDVRRQQLLNEYDHARNIAKDRSAIKAVLADIKEYNREVPGSRKRITGKTLAKSNKSRSQDRRLRSRGIPTEKGDIPIFRETERLFPSIDFEDAPR